MSQRQDNGREYVLRMYLDNLTTYAESSYGGPFLDAEDRGTYSDTADETDESSKIKNKAADPLPDGRPPSPTPPELSSNDDPITTNLKLSRKAKRGTINVEYVSPKQNPSESGTEDELEEYEAAQTTSRDRGSGGGRLANGNDQESEEAFSWIPQATPDGR